MIISFQIQLSLKNAWLPPIFFLDSDSPWLKTGSFHSLKSWKSIVVSLGKFLKKPEDARDAQSVCAVTKGGTVLKTFADRSAGLSMYMKRKQ